MTDLAGPHTSLHPRVCGGVKAWRLFSLGWLSSNVLQISLRHLAQVHRLVVRLLVDTLLVGDLTQQATRAGGLLDDLGRLVVADVRIERRGGGQRRLGRAVTALLVGLDPRDTLLGEDP